jgi:prevent-host-death family protein
MKTATVADLRNDFKKVSAWLEVGEKVEITKRGKPYAVLTRASEETEDPAPKTLDWAARRKRNWGDRFFTDEEIEEMREAEAGQFEQK